MIKNWSGEPIDYHVGVLKKYNSHLEGMGMIFKCCECNEDIYCQDFSVAKKHICILCMTKIIENDIKLFQSLKEA